MGLKRISNSLDMDLMSDSEEESEIEDVSEDEDDDDESDERNSFIDGSAEETDNEDSSEEDEGDGSDSDFINNGSENEDESLIFEGGGASTGGASTSAAACSESESESDDDDDSPLKTRRSRKREVIHSDEDEDPSPSKPGPSGIRRISETDDDSPLKIRRPRKREAIPSEDEEPSLSKPGPSGIGRIPETDEEDSPVKVRRRRTRVVSSSSSNASTATDDDCCTICLSGFSDQLVGVPDVCEHRFCADCLLEWTNNVHTCPIDRRVIRYVIVKDKSGELVRKQRVTKRRKEEIEAAMTVDEGNEGDAAEMEDYDELEQACEACGAGDREDSLLLCDGCDHAYHLECLVPPLDRVPSGNWFCPSCAPTSASTSRGRTRRPAASPTRRRRAPAAAVVDTPPARARSRRPRANLSSFIVDDDEDLVGEDEDEYVPRADAAAEEDDFSMSSGEEESEIEVEPRTLQSVRIENRIQRTIAARRGNTTPKRKKTKRKTRKSSSTKKKTTKKKTTKRKRKSTTGKTTASGKKKTTRKRKTTKKRSTKKRKTTKGKGKGKGKSSSSSRNVSDSREPAPEFTLFGHRHDLDFHGDDSVYPEPSTSSGGVRQPMSRSQAAEILSQAKSSSAAASKIREEQPSTESGDLLGSIIGAQRTIFRKSSPVALQRPGEVYWKAAADTRSPAKKVESSDSAQAASNKFLDRANKRSSDVLSYKKLEERGEPEKKNPPKRDANGIAKSSQLSNWSKPGEPEKKNPPKRDANGVSKSSHLGNGGGSLLGISRDYNSAGFSSRDSSSSSSSGSPQKQAKVPRLESTTASASASASVNKVATECNRGIDKVLTLLAGKSGVGSQVAGNESNSSSRHVKEKENSEAPIRVKDKVTVAPKPPCVETNGNIRLQAGTSRSPKESSEDKFERLNLISNAVKKHLRPFYYDKTISKDEYKTILGKAVMKIKESGTNHVNEDKVKAMMAKYVENITRKTNR